MSPASLRGATRRMPSHRGHAPLHHGRCRLILIQRRLPDSAKFGFLGDDRGLRAGRKRCGSERDSKQPYEFPCTRGRNQRRFKLSTARPDVDARSTGAANGRHVAIPRSCPSPSRKPTRGNGGTESGRKRGRMRSCTASSAQFRSSVVIVSHRGTHSRSTASMRASRDLVDRHLVRDAAQRHAPGVGFSPLVSSRARACAFSTTCSVTTIEREAARPWTREAIFTVWPK